MADSGSGGEENSLIKGGFIPYERAHRTRLAAIFIPKFPQLPAEVVHHLLPFWADVGGH